MAPTRRKKKSEKPEKPQRPSVKRGPAPVAPEDVASGKGNAAAKPEGAAAGRAASGASSRGLFGRGKRKPEASGDERGGRPVESASSVDVADEALYAGSDWSTVDASEEEDRRGTDGFARGNSQVITVVSAGSPLPEKEAVEAKSVLPEGAISARLDTGIVVEALSPHPAATSPQGPSVADAPRGGGAGGDAQSPRQSCFGGSATGTSAHDAEARFVSTPAGPSAVDSVAGGSSAASPTSSRPEAEGRSGEIPCRTAEEHQPPRHPERSEGSFPDNPQASADPDAAPTAGPSELSEEERAAFYSAVPQEREEKKGRKRPTRKGRVATAKGAAAGGDPNDPNAPAGGKGRLFGNPRAGFSRKKGAAGKDASGQADASRRVTVGFVVKIVLAVVLVLAVAMTAVAAVAYTQVRDGNDVEDFQGTWYLNGTDVPVEITADKIVLTRDVAYGYTLDTSDKTIQLKFGNMAGQGWYLFSLNRQQLVIVDGEPNPVEEFFSNLTWTLAALAAQARGEDYPLPDFDKATYLNRAPAPGGAKTDASGAENLMPGSDSSTQDSASSQDAANEGGNANSSDAQANATDNTDNANGGNGDASNGDASNGDPANSDGAAASNDDAGSSGDANDADGQGASPDGSSSSESSRNGNANDAANQGASSDEGNSPESGSSNSAS